MTIKEWVKDNAEGLMPDQHFTDEELKHITMCCEHLFEWATLDRPLGGFLTAVKDNNFITACIPGRRRKQKSTLSLCYVYAQQDASR